MKIPTIQTVALSFTLCLSFAAAAGSYTGKHTAGTAYSGAGVSVRGGHYGSYSGPGVSVRGGHYGSYSTREHHSTGHGSRYGYRYHGYGRHSSYRYGRGYYGSRSYSYHGYRRHGYYGYYPGLVWGILSIPARIVDGFLGYPYYYPHRRYVLPSTGQYGDQRVATIAGSAQDVGPMGATGPGWVLLSNGQYGQAEDIFSRDSRYRPSDGVAKIGLSLSAAAGGDLDRGIWAMRRAARIDPESLVYVTLEQPLQVGVNRLLGRYKKKLERSPRDPDTAFMLASLSYLLGDDSGAQRAIEDAIRYGDNSPSAQNLELLIKDRQSGGESPAPSPLPSRG